MITQQQKEKFLELAQNPLYSESMLASLLFTSISTVRNLRKKARIEKIPIATYDPQIKRNKLKKQIEEIYSQPDYPTQTEIAHNLKISYSLFVKLLHEIKEESITSH